MVCPAQYTPWVCPAGVVPGVPVSLQVGVHLVPESDGEHPFSAPAADLIEGEGELMVSIVPGDYSEHPRTSSRRRHHAGGSDQETTEGTPRPSPGPASTTSVHTSLEAPAG